MFGTSDQFGGIIRTLLAAAATAVAAKGFGDAATDQTIAGAVGVIIIALWSWYSNRPAKVVANPGTGPAVATHIDSTGTPMVLTTEGVKVPLAAAK